MIKMTAIVPGSKVVKNVEALQKEWKQALRDERDAILVEYRKTYHNWGSLHQPNERTKIVGSGDNWYAEVRLTGRIYWFVHESISVLRAVFSNDWSPKTEPKVLASGSGSGRMVYASRQIANPPYEAREFTEKIVEDEQPKFQKRMEEATRRGAQQALAERGK